MKFRLIAILLLLFLSKIAFSQNQILDKVIAIVGDKEPITLLEFEKRKLFFISRISNVTGSLTNVGNLQSLDKEIMERLIIEKMVFLIGKEKNVIVPDDNKIISGITDEKLREEVKKERLFLHDYISEIKQQYILSRIVTSEDTLKNYLSGDPTEEEVNEMVGQLYEKNKQNLKTVKASFIIISVLLPANITLKEEKEIEDVFLEISNLVEKKKYRQAVQLAENKLRKYLVPEATKFVEQPKSFHLLVREGFPMEFLGPIANVKLGQPLPYPIKGLKLKGKEYAIALKLLSREETELSKEEFKSMITQDQNFKQQLSLKVYEDRLRMWIVKTFRSYGYDVNFLDKTYEVKIW
ncbi:MAG: hypothetical protein ABDH28_07620 [Brevinematia bacterium]